MNIDDAFPTRFLKADDLGDARVRVKISAVTIEDFGNEKKPAIWFVGKKKGVSLNKTRAVLLKGLLGPETDDWIGQELIIYATTVLYQGELKASIAIEGIRPNQPTTADF